MLTEADDVANGDEEERFETGVRRSALDFVQHDKNADKMLDYDEYCALVREREEARGGHTDEELRLRFDDLDDGKTGRVSLHSYIRASLREALSRSATRVIDLFRLWDEDGSGTIERKEFRRAIRALGFDFFANNAEIDLVFDDFDIDGSGKLEYKELNTMLRQGQSVRLADELLNGAAGAIVKESKNVHRLRKHRSRAVRSVLPSTVILHADGSRSVVEQLRDIVKDNWIRVIDLFRSWDEDGDGLIDRGEFRKAIAALGFEASREHIDAVFAPFDIDGSGKIEYSELRALLHRSDPTLDASFRPGAAGEIELSARRERTGPSAPVNTTTPTRARSSFSKEPSSPIHSSPIHSSPRKQQSSSPRVASLSKQPSPPRLPAIPTGGAFGYGERMVTEREMRMRRTKLSTKRTVARPSPAHTTPRRSAVARPTPRGATPQRWPIGDAIRDAIGKPIGDGDNDDEEGCGEPESNEDLAVETAEGAWEALVVTLRSKLDGVLVGGGDGGEQLHRDLRGRVAITPPSASLAAAQVAGGATSSSPCQSPGGVREVALKPRYLLSEHGQQRVAAATAIQAQARGRFARTSGRTGAREWLFGHSFRRVVCLEPSAVVLSASAVISGHPMSAVLGASAAAPVSAPKPNEGNALSTALVGSRAPIPTPNTAPMRAPEMGAEMGGTVHETGASGGEGSRLGAHLGATTCGATSRFGGASEAATAVEAGVEATSKATSRGHETTCTVHVRRHERLELVGASGHGRLLLDAHDMHGRCVVAQSCVYDSSLQSIPGWGQQPQLGAQVGEYHSEPRGGGNARGGARVGGARGEGPSAPLASPTLCCLPGEFVYSFRIEAAVAAATAAQAMHLALAPATGSSGSAPAAAASLTTAEGTISAPQGPLARLELRFRIESRFSEAELLREPSPPDRPSDRHSGGPLRAGGGVQGAQQKCGSGQQRQRQGDYRASSMPQATPSPSIPARTLSQASPPAGPRRVERHALFSDSTEAIEATRLQARLQERQHIGARDHAADVEAHQEQLPNMEAHHEQLPNMERSERPRGHAQLIALDGRATTDDQRSPPEFYHRSPASTSLARAPPPIQWPGSFPHSPAKVLSLSSVSPCMQVLTTAPGSFPYGSDPANAYYYGLLPPPWSTPWQDARVDASGVHPYLEAAHPRHDLGPLPSRHELWVQAQPSPPKKQQPAGRSPPVSKAGGAIASPRVAAEAKRNF